MTFFLANDEGIDTSSIRPVHPGGDITGFWQGLGAGTRKAALENDANFRIQRTGISVREDLATRALEHMGLDSVRATIEERNRRAREAGLPSQERPMPKTVGEAIEAFGPNFAREVLDIARVRASGDPDSWAEFDLSEQAIDAEINARLQAEHQDAVDTLAMMPWGQGTAEFVGGMAGVSIDVKNVPFLLMGGGSGSLLRIMGREAMINTAAEGVFIPSQFEAAERLDIEDPNIMQQLAMAAAAGAVFGAGIEGVSRAFSYMRGRERLQKTVPGYNATRSRELVDTAEDALASSSRPFETIAQALENGPRPRPFVLENPLNPEREPLVLAERDRVPPDVVEREAIERAASDAEARGPAGRRPFITALTRSVRDGNDLRIDPDSAIGQELKARDINSRTAPGLFRRGGRGELDNLVAAEFEERFPGISQAAGVDDTGRYLRPQGVREIIEREVAGDTDYLNARAEAQAIRESAGRSAADDFAEQVDGGGFVVNPDQYELAFGNNARAQMSEDIVGWLQEEGYADILSDAEMDEIVAMAARDGGDVEFLVERALEREAEFVTRTDDTATDIPFDAPPRANAEGAGEPEPVTGETAGSAQGVGRGEADAIEFEQTNAGQQGVVPGVAGVSQREILENRQNAPLRGGDNAADDGLFDLGARLQTDMFDSTDTPAAAARLAQMTEDTRDAISIDGEIDIEIPLEDGSFLRSSQQVLDYLDEGDDFADILDMCGRPAGDAS